jgi:hypothetical protein
MDYRLIVSIPAARRSRSPIKLKRVDWDTQFEGKYSYRTAIHLENLQTTAALHDQTDVVDIQTPE